MGCARGAGSTPPSTLLPVQSHLDYLVRPRQRTLEQNCLSHRPFNATQKEQSDLSRGVPHPPTLKATRFVFDIELNTLTTALKSPDADSTRKCVCTQATPANRQTKIVQPKSTTQGSRPVRRAVRAQMLTKIQPIILGLRYVWRSFRWSGFCTF
jgi:hypothetical protein